MLYGKWSASDDFGGNLALLTSSAPPISKLQVAELHNPSLEYVDSKKI